MSKAYESARTIRVRLAFSIENLTFPPSPAIRPASLSASCSHCDDDRQHTDRSCEVVAVQSLDVLDLE